MSSNETAVSIVVVSDYGGRTADDWRYLRATLEALNQQAFDGRVEVLLADAAPPGQEMPPDLATLVPSARVLRDPALASTELLNSAVDAASAELVVMLDGDCAAVPEWLQAAVDAMRRHPDAAAVSGLTAYPYTSFRNRVLATLSRSFLDPGRAGPTRFISTNNVIFRRDVLRAHPLGPLVRAMAMRMQSEAIRLDGGVLYFEPRMRVTHRFEGWPMERRIRRNIGYRAIRIRQLDPRIPYSWMVRLGPLSIPAVLSARILESCWNCVRAGSHYGLRWFELPAAFATAFAVHMLEVRGMRAAFDEARSAERAAERSAARAAQP